jgi:hypothetical protein
MQAPTKTASGSAKALQSPQLPPDRPSRRGGGRVSLGDRIVTTRVGLLMPTDLSLDDWASAGRKLSRIADSTSWCLGDWLAHGQMRFRGRYQRAAEEVGLDTQTLRNYAWLARKFDHPRRRPTLSLQHHAEVASLPVPEQDHWLDLAAQGRWSRNELRRRIRAGRRNGTSEEPARSATAGTDTAGTDYLPRLTVTVDQLAQWRQAAEQTSTDLNTWVVQTLNDAARHEATVSSADGHDAGN